MPKPFAHRWSNISGDDADALAPSRPAALAPPSSEHMPSPISPFVSSGASPLLRQHDARTPAASAHPGPSLWPLPWPWPWTPSGRAASPGSRRGRHDDHHHDGDDDNTDELSGDDSPLAAAHAYPNLRSLPKRSKPAEARIDMSHTVSSSSPRLAANVSETSTLASTAVAAAHELVRTMGPIVLWLLLFANCKYIPSEWRPTISVATLPVLDKFLFESGFGLLLSACVCVAVGTWWLRSSVSAGYFAFVPLVLAALHDLANVDPNAAFDLALFLPYGILHYISPVLFTAWLYKYGPPGSIRVFLQALGWQNFAGVVTQLVFPCAAPWYNDKYGFQPANYSIPGDPAGLSNVDALLGTHMFTNTFNSSPLVFGAMPSLHSGFACLIMFFALHISPRAGRAAVAYVAWMWTATMYFRHHYMVDVIAGCGYAFVAYWVARPVLGVKAEIALPAPAIAGPARRRSLSESLSASGAGLRPPSIAEFSRQTSAVSLVATDFSIKSYQALGPAAPPPAPLLSVSINDLQRVGHKVLCGLPQHQQPSFFCLHVSLHQRQHVPYSLRPP